MKKALWKLKIQAKRAKLKKTEQPVQQAKEKMRSQLAGSRHNFPQYPVSRDDIMQTRNNLRKVDPKVSAIDLEMLDEI